MDVRNSTSVGSQENLEAVRELAPVDTPLGPKQNPNSDCIGARKNIETVISDLNASSAKLTVVLGTPNFQPPAFTDAYEQYVQSLDHAHNFGNDHFVVFWTFHDDLNDRSITLVRDDQLPPIERLAFSIRFGKSEERSAYASQLRGLVASTKEKLTHTIRDTLLRNCDSPPKEDPPLEAVQDLLVQLPSSLTAS